MTTRTSSMKSEGGGRGAGGHKGALGVIVVVENGTDIYDVGRGNTSGTSTLQKTVERFLLTIQKKRKKRRLFSKKIAYFLRK